MINDSMLNYFLEKKHNLIFTEKHLWEFSGLSLKKKKERNKKKIILKHLNQLSRKIIYFKYLALEQIWSWLDIFSQLKYEDAV